MKSASKICGKMYQTQTQISKVKFGDYKNKPNQTASCSNHTELDAEDLKGCRLYLRETAEKFLLGIIKENSIKLFTREEKPRKFFLSSFQT